MTMKKTVVGVVSGAIVLALAWGGFSWYGKCRKERADRRAYDCMHEYARIVGDGRGAVPAEKLKPVLAEMEELSEVCSGFIAETLFARRLDGAFLVGDYALAERMMDDMPGKSASWKEGAKAKIRAHAALERGDKAAAIGEFETFCKILREQPDCVEADPCSGIEWSREGLLARNLKRMSDLAAEIGDAERAARYLDEAGRCATIALKKAEDDEETKAVMTKELGSFAK